MVPEVIFPSSIAEGWHFCSRYSNPVTSPWTVTSSSTNHHHRATPCHVTPESNLIAALEGTIASRLSKTFRYLILSAILYVTSPQTPVLRPNCAIPEVAVACDFRSECVITETVTCGLQQRSVMRVVTARDLELVATDQPKCWRNHVSIILWIYRFSSSVNSVIPPVTSVIHPMFFITIREPTNKHPPLVAWCQVAVYLRQNYSSLYIIMWLAPWEGKMNEAQWINWLSLLVWWVQCGPLVIVYCFPKKWCVLTR